MNGLCLGCGHAEHPSICRAPCGQDNDPCQCGRDDPVSEINGTFIAMMLAGTWHMVCGAACQLCYSAGCEGRLLEQDGGHYHVMMFHQVPYWPMPKIPAHMVA
jgi:hypothetical protein